MHCLVYTSNLTGIHITLFDISKRLLSNIFLLLKCPPKKGVIIIIILIIIIIVVIVIVITNLF